MTSTRIHARPLVLVPLVALLLACSPGGVPTVAPGGSAAGGTRPQSSPSPAGEGAASPVGKSETPWGFIWDRVPPWFPQYPGASPAPDASAAPSSARYAVQGGDPSAIATWLRSKLESYQYQTDASSPLEDGTITLDSVGQGRCRIRTTVSPLGGVTFITVLYGADCSL